MAVTMNYLIIFSLLTLVSCSGEGGKSDANISSGMNIHQKEAQSLIKKDISSLQNGQYAISDNDLALLKKEGLISQEELNSLNVVK